MRPILTGNAKQRLITSKLIEKEKEDEVRRTHSKSDEAWEVIKQSENNARLLQHQREDEFMRLVEVYGDGLIYDINDVIKAVWLQHKPTLNNHQLKLVG